MSRVRKVFAVLCSSAMLAVVAASPAAAQGNQNNQQNGLVNVNLNNTCIACDVNVGVAAQVAANVCGVKVGPVAVLGAAVDRSGATELVCNSQQGPVTISQA